ncbi:MAG: ABC transporter permease, partial [Bacilli bacterium]|nr:ABC transporter permease [Bacilli bacterium]
LAKNDFKAKFAGSFFGVFWAFINPIIITLLYVFVFQVGLKSGNVSDYPFVLYLMTGLVPWFFFQDSLNSSTNSLNEYSYLVKKVVFPVEILPTIKVLSSLFIHLFFVAFIIIVCSCFGYFPTLSIFQLIYYGFALLVLVIGLAYLCSALQVFFKDLSQIVGILLTIGIWITPIMWNVNVLSPSLSLLFKLNPFYYIIDGFRNSLLTGKWFVFDYEWAIWFWAINLLIYYTGAKVFTKTKPHMADVL